MGILTRRQAEYFVISSDHTAEPSTKRAPRHLANDYQVWTGADWSTDMSSAMRFESLDDADDYVKSHYATIRI